MDIFIADDSDPVRSSIKKLCAKSAQLHVIGEAADGKTAIEQIMKLKPDVALLDILMPLKTGIEVAREARACLPKMKIVVLSNYADSYSRARCLEAGVDYVFRAMIQMLQQLSSAAETATQSKMEK
jgi:DNA-binding NarL/FixJ family response regulator